MGTQRIESLLEGILQTSAQSTYVKREQTAATGAAAIQRGINQPGIGRADGVDPAQYAAARKELEAMSSSLQRMSGFYGQMSSMQQQAQAISEATGKSYSESLKHMSKMLDMQKGIGAEGKKIHEQQQNALKTLMQQESFLGKINKWMKDNAAQEQKNRNLQRDTISGRMGAAISGGSAGSTSLGPGAIESALGGTIIGSIIGGGRKVLNVAAGMMNSTLKSFNLMQQGVEGVLQSGANSVVSVVSVFLPRIGALLGTLFQGVIQALMFKFEDALTLNKIKYLTATQTGGSGGQMGAILQGQMGRLGRRETLEWAQGTRAEGISEGKAFEPMLQLSHQFQLGATQTTQMMGQFLIFSNSATQAANRMGASFERMQQAARGTNLSVTQMVGWIQQAGAQTRFLNTDFNTIANTVSMLADRQNQLGRFGISVRQSGGRIANELMGGAGNITDAMHAYFGTQAGLSNNPIHAMVGSMLGEQAMRGMRYTAGGGIDAGTQDRNDMPARRLQTIVQNLQQATQGMDAQTAFVTRRQMAMQTFGFSAESATTLATAGEQDIAELLRTNPEMAHEMKSSTQLLGELQDVAVRSERIQRAMSQVMIAIMSVVIVLPRYIYESLRATLSTSLSTRTEAEFMRANITGFMRGQGRDIEQGLRRAGAEARPFVAPLETAFRVGTTAQFGYPANPQASGGWFNIPAFAGGGYFGNGSLLVGERGPEIIDFERGRVTENSSLPGQLGRSGGGTTVVININGAASRTELMREIEAAVRENYFA